MCSGCHEDDVFFFVYFVEEPPCADSVSPRGGGVIFEFLDIWAEVRAEAELGIYVLAKFLCYPFLPGAGDGREVLGELVRLKDSILTQRTAPFGSGRRPSRPSYI